LKILLGGPLFQWNTTEARRRALHALGHEVVAVDVRTFLDRGPGLARKVRWQLLAGNAIHAYNRALLEAGERFRPTLVWLELPIQVYSRTVNELRQMGSVTLSHHAEYLGFRKYQYRHFFKAVTSYDVHVVTNELSAAMLADRGARSVIMTEFGYDPDLHRPITLNESEGKLFRSDVVFAGHWEPSYARKVLSLRRAGFELALYGSNWSRAIGLADRRSVRPIFGEAYVKALVGARLGLGLVSGWNRNQATHRTFEIPACGGFLLAQRTRQHQEYFTEGKEAEFFDSDDELIDKSHFYLSHDNRRRAIAKAGYERCVASGHTIRQLTGRILEQLS
jgi:hypothetical protein